MEDEIIIEELDDEEIIIDESSSNEEIAVEDEDIINLGTNDYKKLKNKPQIEGIELIDNKSFEDLGAISLTNLEIENLIKMQI